MKIISKYLKLLPVFLLVLVLTGCSDDDDNNTPTTVTVVDVAVANGFTSLAAALQATDLVTTLQGPGPFTVFAPTNEAFDDLLTATGLDLANLSTSEEELVRQILLNHVIVGTEVPSSAITTTGIYANTGADAPGNNNLSIYARVNADNNNTVEINGGDGTTSAPRNGADVTTPDVPADNGVIHVINKVLGLPTVVDMALANPEFGSLVASLTTAGQPDFVSILSTANGTSPAPFTVFAPTNAAFQTLLDSNMMWNSPADIDSALLTAVLQHHVLAGQNVQSGDLNQSGTTSPETLQGQTIDITLPGTNGNIADVVDGAGNEAGIRAVDVQTSNGVIHVVNAVLLPAS
ncbi:fasciclin domain-containing protein [Winogradskyella jejuensis]|uniref:Uncaracterized surface protein containing fasciclin (FAS1) repeats n=1 Tax=Winogradskyella jejuensis TaxID=1089305 RepID=A0A1M5SFA8_9FLAO|nr:fasciclin domain-containing protein [Winogradskyella jejuensis]SHH37135.1 Uncaracterized surface protein containing fasciclin (FAS1) repeats [Winogradskyella jejuensis]